MISYNKVVKKLSFLIIFKPNYHKLCLKFFLCLYLYLDLFNNFDNVNFYVWQQIWKKTL